ncbi:hypothetical protein [Aminipila terrae]|uniref:Uncharacterized protein n=1 Tax=Aminipila terrae TaxID=2697030 RepID=A0A6P1MLA2_9FIRM|nr:hypothetical protein [Aminipila terrae]QHI73454.1 hypothetical protein Ami3637_14675 [Aminipila terrae]
MTVNELRVIISKNNKIPSDCYSLDGGLPNEAFCIAHLSGKWEVYYSERGKKSNLKTFEMESEACEYFYERLQKMLRLN